MPVPVAAYLGGSALAGYIYGKFSGGEENEKNLATDGLVPTVDQKISNLSFSSTFKIIAIGTAIGVGYYYAFRKK